MPNNELLTLTSENFVLNKSFFKEDFFGTQNTKKRNWFFKTFTSERSKIQSEFYDYITLHKSSMLFFDWFELHYASVHNIAYPFASIKHTCPITTRSKASTWNLSSGQTIESDHPPLRNLQLELQNQPVEATPYKLPSDNTLTNTKHIINQNNFTNRNLGTLNKPFTNSRKPNRFPETNPVTPNILNQHKYNVSSLYKRNIDGMSEYNILNTLQQMTMAVNAYKTQTGTPDRAIVELLIAGFSGQLKGWWDYHLTEADHLHILNSIQQYEDKTPVLDSSGNTIQDAVSCLILTISLHFIGDPSHLKDKNAELLSNLRCKKLSDFQWYKNTFMTRFLAGLPILLGEKVRNKIKETYSTKLIPYDQLTYGELFSFTQKEGLEIC
ncbi:polyprotein [Salix suchowensis]|nr:polyprotein [Salix suchowensis]